MTRIREKTMEIIARLPEDKIIYVFNILQNIEAISANEPHFNEQTSQEALATLMKYQGTIKEGFDYKAELEAARNEKYENIN